jgi:glyoxylase-like metal-dependent hydrolase (beta-lactamase superfamily II)
VPARRLAEGVWALRLGLPYPFVKSVNAYAVEGDGGLVLVDCGSALEDGWSRLAAALHEAGIAPEHIVTLLCTHGHADHCGLAAEVVGRTGCSFVMAPGEHRPIDALRDPTRTFDERRALHRRHGTPEDEIPALAEEVNGDGLHTLPHETAPPPAIGAWHVLPAPGHATDQVMLWEPGRRWLIGADLAIRGVRPFVEYGTSATPHADYLASLERALALEPELLLPGHGRPVEDPTAVLAESKACIEDGARRIGDALGDRPRTAYELAQHIVADTTIPARQRALSEALCALEHLETQGVARSTEDAGVVRYASA